MEILHRLGQHLWIGHLRQIGDALLSDDFTIPGDDPEVVLNGGIVFAENVAPGNFDRCAVFLGGDIHEPGEGLHNFSLRLAYLVEKGGSFFRELLRC